MSTQEFHEPLFPGIIIRTKVNLGEQDREIGFETSIDRDAEQGEIDHLCDKIMATANRLRAKHLLPVYRRQLDQLEYKHAENRGRLAEGDAKLAALAEAREERRRKLLDSLNGKLDNDRGNWLASGRRGEYKPAQSVGREERAALAELDQGQTRDEQEWAVQKDQLDTELKEGRRAIDQMNAMIAELEAHARVAANED